MSQRLAARGLPTHKITTVHNWVPAEAVRPLPRGAWQLPGLVSLNGSFVVMYSGNMGMAHEFETILDAAALLKEDRAVQFVFAGGGKRRAEVEAGVAVRGLRNVAFLESRPLSELAQLLSAADVHLVSMREEVLGTLVPSKIYGILAAGRPALFVGPPRCEVADLIRASGAGESFRAGEASRLASVIRRLAANQVDARRLGQAGRSHYERFLGRERSVASIIAVVTGSRGPRRFEPDVQALQRRRRQSGRTQTFLSSELHTHENGL